MDLYSQRRYFVVAMTRNRPRSSRPLRGPERCRRGWKVSIKPLRISLTVPMAVALIDPPLVLPNSHSKTGVWRIFHLCIDPQIYRLGLWVSSFRTHFPIVVRIDEPPVGDITDINQSRCFDISRINSGSPSFLRVQSSSPFPLCQWQKKRYWSLVPALHSRYNHKSVAKCQSWRLLSIHNRLLRTIESKRPTFLNPRSFTFILITASHIPLLLRAILRK